MDIKNSTIFRTGNTNLAMKNVDIKDVRSFWEENPLFQGESKYEPGSLGYFDGHRRVYIEDCLAGLLDERLFPDYPNGLTLDLGCGPAFWPVEFLLSGKAKNVVAADLTYRALQIAGERLAIYNLGVYFVQANAEILPFSSCSFDHINCQGVIHHTPNTEKCIAEIARVLKERGSAVISVYYRNIFLRHWNKLCGFGKLLASLGAKLPGRGRENIFYQKNANEIIRLYDGSDNPLGKAYSRKEFIDMLRSYFEIEEIFFHFFPARSLPISIPKVLHRWLDRNIPFMIYARLRKPGG